MSKYTVRLSLYGEYGFPIEGLSLGDAIALTDLVAGRSQNRVAATLQREDEPEPKGSGEAQEDVSVLEVKVRIELDEETAKLLEALDA